MDLLGPQEPEISIFFRNRRQYFIILFSKIVKLFSNSLFLRRHKSKMIFGQTTPVDSNRKCKFQRFCICIFCKSISVRSLYTNEVTDCLKPAGISLASIHQHLKNNANPCVCLIALVSKINCMILKIDQDSLLTVQTSFVRRCPETSRKRDRS